MIVKALHRLKSSGWQRHEFLGDILRGLGFKHSRFDSDVWYRLNKEHDLYEYIGTHTDDLLVVGPLGSLDAIKQSSMRHSQSRAMGNRHST